MSDQTATAAMVSTAPGDKECDLVMKGGITSGIVYPGAVQKLHAAGYRFRSIGGASAGAIAAGLTAAAQFAGPEGFKRLELVSAQLAQPGFLLGLFQPSTASAKTLFSLAGAVAAKPTMSGRARAAISGLGASAGSRPAQGSAAGAAVGALPLLAATGIGVALGLDPRSGLLASLAGGVVGGALGYFAGKTLGSVEALPRLVDNALAEENAFGLCLGHGNGAAAAKTGQLTDWLAWAIDYVAGRTTAEQVAGDTQPLTLRDLRAEGVDFRAMTSNLSEGQPYVLPFQKKNFLFCETDMRRLFPPHVVDYMVEKRHRGGSSSEKERGKLPAGYHFLPFNDDFPVVLAVRMSLSFPVLISAVPLYKLTEEGWSKLNNGRALDPKTDLRRHWFSDGGLSSNFPIHFFDAWVPSRPTFGINLVAAPSGQPVPAPTLQRANPPGEPDTWTSVNGLAGFFNAIWSTAQNFRDNMQSQLPSYRERIVPVALTSAEGGLNLNMPAEVVETVMKRGEQAGAALAAFDLNRHKWVRYRVLMKLLEDNLLKLGEAIGKDAVHFKELTGLQTVAGQNNGSRYPYAEDEGWCAEAARRTALLEACVREWGEPHFAEGSPKPPSALRVTPDV